MAENCQMAENCLRGTLREIHVNYVTSYIKLRLRPVYPFHKMAATWSGDGANIENGEIIVQRLSAEVTGKAQKFSRIGPREFVSFAYNEVTIVNLKRACEKHFEAQLGQGLICDVLVGEQGLSCKTVEQIPNVKMIHVRFISWNDLDIIEPESMSMISARKTSETCAKKLLASSSSVSAKPKAVESKSVLQSRSSPSKFYPRSLCNCMMTRCCFVLEISQI